MMREGKHLRRRGMAVAALTIVLSLAAPELAAPLDAATARSSSRTEMQARAAARPDLTARSERSAAGSARKAATQPGARIRAARARRRAARTRRQRTRRGKRTNRRVKRKGKRTKRQRTRTQRRNSAKGKRTKRRAAAAAKRSKGGSSKSLSTFGWLEILFFVLLPFLAVAGLLFGTDYQRKPRAPSRTKRKRSLVITPVSRKF
jgi:hypothetical protein